MAMVEDVIDGKDKQHTKEAFAMFADLHKCYMTKCGGTVYFWPFTSKESGGRCSRW